MDRMHYRTRKDTSFIRNGFAEVAETRSVLDAHSVGAYVKQEKHMNNAAAVASGLRDVFVAVANHGAFFRAAHTRREVNYWLPGLNAGIPFVAKKDPIHEITFASHDFGHFLIPDLIYTGGTSCNGRRIYILYRMMSEATTLVFADMLFVETLVRSGYEYDWTSRQIHPLFKATGLNPFDAGTRTAFFENFRMLLEANVAYCLLGDDSKFLDLIRANGALDTRKDGDDADGPLTYSTALENFKAKYMPFFVEDYRWTSANHANMASNHGDYKRWWELVTPLVEASGISGATASGIGLETVEMFMAAIGVEDDDDTASVPTPQLIGRIFDRVFNTRIKPVLEVRDGPLALDPPDVRRTRAFVRYIIGQSIIFARFAFVPEAAAYSEKVLGHVARRARGGGTLSEAEIAAVRALYAQFLRTLQAKSFLTPDDVENFKQICPLFDPVFVFYDESKAFYAELSEVQAQILNN
eukprot:NODE_5673_length_1745_cov_4.501854.p1 GENE.NODE_5673_length_1745_cov_4.501854~~NODE_5673_length_1745_cov_4.501854.p1  ORF type:complete len:485 (+),score=183.86 NODE_5673_length_1745_cov_4.501854:54-1457(+)